MGIETIEKTPTLLYSKSRKIYPVTIAEGVNVSPELGDNVEQCLRELYEHMSLSEGTDLVVSNIIIDVKYLISDSNQELDVKELLSWTSSYSQPNRKYPYAWKKTTFTYKGDKTPEKNLKTIYEIIATDLSERIDTIYLALNTSENTGLIEYPKIPNPLNPEEQMDNPRAFDNELPLTSTHLSWSREPQAISPSSPYVFMATRKMNTPELINHPDKVNFGPGKWGYYTKPAQYGCWPADSILVTRYATSLTLEPPALNNKIETPEGWEASITVIPPGTLSIWMITANSINGELSVDSKKKIWNDPTLISIIK